MLLACSPNVHVDQCKTPAAILFTDAALKLSMPKMTVSGIQILPGQHLSRLCCQVLQIAEQYGQHNCCVLQGRVQVPYNVVQ